MGKPERINEVFNDINFIKLSMNKSMIGKKKHVEKSNRVLETEQIASKLQGIYHAPQSYSFFLKCAWNLPESTIWDAVEASRRPWIKSPVKYFVKTCSNRLSEQA